MTENVPSVGEPVQLVDRRPQLLEDAKVFRQQWFPSGYPMSCTVCTGLSASRLLDLLDFFVDRLDYELNPGSSANRVRWLCSLCGQELTEMERPLHLMWHDSIVPAAGADGGRS